MNPPAPVKRLCLVVAGFAILLQPGCAWVTDVLIDSLTSDQVRRDGREDDADGLTRRDIVARAEESRIRSWDRGRLQDEWRERAERDAAVQSYRQQEKALDEHFSRDRSKDLWTPEN